MGRFCLYVWRSLSAEEEAMAKTGWLSFCLNKILPGAELTCPASAPTCKLVPKVACRACVRHYTENTGIPNTKAQCRTIIIKHEALVHLLANMPTVFQRGRSHTVSGTLGVGEY
ncbi:hypothetical protein BaRGS_00007132 [Batillaria attramentaria]|uniref:Secreted protein n=1 Tax=Batillaria attramentaria TaxID=370345 RepID=A0ABD0LQG1_9CAEN